MKAKITFYLISLLILTIIITFCSFSCSPPSPDEQTIEEPAQETAEEIAVEEPEEEPAEEIVADEPVEEPSEEKDAEIEASGEDEEKDQEKEQDLSQDQQTEQAQEEQQQEEQEEQTYGIEVVSLTSPISRGSQASITIKTAPNVQCSITVHYKSGPSKAKGLELKNSDGNGNCTWSWKVGSRTTPGDWKIVLKAEGAGQIETYFAVTE